ncbi:MAG: oligosaccharide flippase family protein [Lachnospiraceae bacterium]|nr:oligosaccharide flippase family protein [Lachnospiraceae bacterium]
MNKIVFKNISLNFIMKGITYIFSFIIVMYATRILQPLTYGRVSFAGAFAGYFVMFSQLGMPIYAMRGCAGLRSDRSALSRFWNEIFSINLVLSVFSILVLSVLIFFLPRLRENALLLIISGSGMIFQMFGSEWLYRGLEKFRFLTVTMLICKLISLLAILAFVHSPQHMIRYAVFSVFTGYGSDVVCFLALRRYVDISFRIKINREHFKPLLIFSLMSCAVYVYSSLDLTMLGFMKTDYETGLYGLAAKAKTMLAATGGLVWASVLPTATSLWRDNRKAEFETLACKSLMLVSLVQFAVTVFCLVFAKQIILIMGGEEYLDAVPSFRILLFSLLPIGLSNILGGQVLIPAGKERELLKAEILGAAFNLLANLFVIPVYSIEGAAFTTVISEVIVWAVCLIAVRGEMGMDLAVAPVIKTYNWIRTRLQRVRVRMDDRRLGDKLPYYCPCCGMHLRSFIDGGYSGHPEQFNPKRYDGIDQQVICPMCGSLPRHRIIVSRLSEQREWLKGKRILHFAQEHSLKLWFEGRVKVAEYTTADLFSAADLQIDIQDTGLEDGAYDLIICNHVLEHVTDYERALRELHRILSPEGKLIISFPVDLSLETVYEDSTVTTEEGRIEHFGQNDHLRVFGRDSAEILRSFGFIVTEIRGEDYAPEIKPVVGPADYDSNVIFEVTV